MSTFAMSTWIRRGGLAWIVYHFAHSIRAVPFGLPTKSPLTSSRWGRTVCFPAHAPQLLSYAHSRSGFLKHQGIEYSEVLEALHHQKMVWLGFPSWKGKNAPKISWWESMARYQQRWGESARCSSRSEWCQLTRSRTAASKSSKILCFVLAG